MIQWLLGKPVVIRPNMMGEQVAKEGKRRYSVLILVGLTPREPGGRPEWADKIDILQRAARRLRIR